MSETFQFNESSRKLAAIGARFAKSVPERIKQLAAAIDDVDELLHQCHKLKGTAGAFGWHELADAAARIEISALELKSEQDQTKREKIVQELKNSMKNLQITASGPPDLNC